MYTQPACKSAVMGNLVEFWKAAKQRMLDEEPPVSDRISTICLAV